MPQLRQNIITGEWVIFAPERAKRPTDYISINKEKKQKKEDCPFCIDSKNSEYPNQKKEYETANTFVISNKFPAYVEDQEVESAKLYKLENEFYKMKLALGGHDVVVVKDHDTDLSYFSHNVFKDLISTFKERFEYYSKIENVEYVMPIYNHGPAAAASIEHPHAQILASAVVPNAVSREMSYTSKYKTEKGECAFCALIKHEKDQNTRILAENDDFIAFNFYAARFPFETWILPKTHQSNFESISDDKVSSFADIAKEVFSRFGKILNDPDLNFFIHSAPIQEKDLDYYHWHMEITPRLSTYGGYELGSGMVIDIVTPEQAAEFMRQGKIEKR